MPPKRRKPREHVPPVSPAVMLERMAERVFISRPRWFVFSHRCTTSLRHPYLVVAVQSIEGLSGQLRVEKIVDALMSTDEVRQRWVQVGQLWCSRMLSAEMDARRQTILGNGDVQMILERWWSSAGGTISRGITEERYRQIHRTLYAAILQEHDVSIMSAANAAIVQDWAYDSRGNLELDFAAFALSLLELADNWEGESVPSSSGFVAVLTRFYDIIFAKSEGNVARSGSIVVRAPSVTTASDVVAAQ